MLSNDKIEIYLIEETISKNLTYLCFIMKKLAIVDLMQKLFIYVIQFIKKFSSFYLFIIPINFKYSFIPKYYIQQMF